MGRGLQNAKGGAEMNCFMCKGDMHKAHTTYFTDAGKCIVIVKNVPCYKCDQCGEIAYEGTVVKTLERIVDGLVDSLTEIAVVSYVA